MNSTIQNTTIDSLLHSLIISKKGFKVGWPFTFATAKGEAQIDRFHSGIWVLCHLSVGVSKEIKRRAEGVQVQLYHQTIKQMADYISFSRQACLVALAGHWQIQDIYLRNISDADLSWNISFTVLVFRAVIAPYWYRISSSTSNITLVVLFTYSPPSWHVTSCHQSMFGAPFKAKVWLKANISLCNDSVSTSHDERNNYL